MNLSRREFLKKSAGGTIAVAGSILVGSGLGEGIENAFGESKDIPKRARVVVARSPHLTNEEGDIDEELLKTLLDNAIKKLIGVKTPSEAWRKIFGLKDIIGIKVNTVGGQKKLSTHPALCRAVACGLAQAEIPQKNVIVWDRNEKELAKAGYDVGLGKDGFKCVGTDSLGIGYEDEPIVAGDIGGCLSRILTAMSTATISMPVLKDHELAGVSLGMKNYYGVISNPSKLHDDNCDPFVAYLNNIPEIRTKHRLTICDGILAQYDGGPGYKPKYAWQYNGLILGLDPVATDYVGMSIIEGKRKEHGKQSILPLAKHVRSCARLGLGVDNPSRIEVIEVGETVKENPPDG